VVAELEPGAEVEVGKVRRHRDRTWAVVTLADGSRGYMDAHTDWLPLKPMRVRQAGAELRLGPNPDARIVRRLPAGAEITPLDLTDSAGRTWLRVRDSTGTEGYLPGETPLQEPKPRLVDSFGGAALVIVTLGALGAAVLCLRGDLTGAVGLLLVCLLGGGLAGLTHWLVAPLRANPFGAPLAWMLIVDTYLLAVGLSVWPLGGAAFAGEPLLWVGLAAAGVVGGLACGYAVLVEQYLQGRRLPLAAWFVPLVGAVGLLLSGFGGYQLLLYQRDWSVFSNTEPEAVDMTLADLLNDGPGDNHYIRLTHFLHCRLGVQVKEERRGQFITTYQWVPIVPATGPPPNLYRPVAHRPKVPAQILAVIVQTDKSWKKPAAAPQSSDDDFAAVRTELNGYTGVILNGVKSLPEDELQKLRELAPDTDIDQVLIIDANVALTSDEEMTARLNHGRAGLILGGMFLVVAGGWAWTATRPRRPEPRLGR
jgi:hypothetical protein